MTFIGYLMQTKLPHYTGDLGILPGRITSRQPGIKWFDSWSTKGTHGLTFNVRLGDKTFVYDPPSTIHALARHWEAKRAALWDEPAPAVSIEAVA